MTEFKLPITIRNLRESDVGWVLSSWSTSQVLDWKRRLERDKPVNGRQNFIFAQDYFFKMHKDFANMRLMESQCLVACQPDDDEQTFGYVVWDGDLLLWIYTKHTFRKTNVGTALYEAAFPNYKEKPTKISTVTYSISHHQDRWNLDLDFSAIKDVK